MGRRAAAGLPGGQAHARRYELEIALGEATQRRHGAPEGQRQGDDIAAVAMVGPAGDGNSGDRVNDCEPGAAQQPQLRVAEAQVGLDRFLQDDQDLPVDEVESVDEGQDAEDVIACLGALRRTVMGEAVHRVSASRRAISRP